MMKKCKECGCDYCDPDWLNPDDDEDYMFEDMRPSQPGLIDLSGLPDPIGNAVFEAMESTKH